MCTTLVYKGRYFGRNMDIDTGFGECIVHAPRGTFTMRRAEYRQLHSMLGTASLVGKYPLYAEAMNPCGLYMAGLNFPGSAVYRTASRAKVQLCPFEVIPYFLGMYDTVGDCREALRSMELIDEPFSADLPLAPLHFFLSDGKESVVIEQTATGTHIYDDPAEVLTNNPEFPYHLLRLQEHRHLTVDNPAPSARFGYSGAPYGEGLGLVGLPGDFSPTSRFIRATFLKDAMEKTDSPSPVSDVFHLLHHVSMPRGAVWTAHGRWDTTTYSICYDAHEGELTWRVYDDPALHGVRFSDFSEEEGAPSCVAMDGRCIDKA